MASQMTPARRRRAAALAAASAALLAATPTATAVAEAAGGSGSTTSPASRATPSTVPAPGELLSAGRLEELLASLPLSDLSVSQVAEYLAGLPEIEALAQLQVGLLGGETLGLVGLEENLAEAIQALGPAATIGELTQVSGLLPHLETQLDDLLTLLLGKSLGGEAQEELAKALRTLDLDQLVSSLLAGAKEPGQLGGLSQLAGGIFEGLGAGNVEELLGAPLEAPFSPTTVEAAAKQLGTTAEGVSGELGQSATALPADATMLTAPVSEGKLLAVAPALKGLAVGLLGGKEEGGGGGEGGPKEGGGSGEGTGSGEGKGSGTGSGTGQGTGQGGTGGNSTPAPGGSGGSTGPLTVILNVPPTGGAAGGSATAPNSAGASKARSSKLRILGTRTHGSHATVVLQAPVAGRLVLRASGIRTRTLQVRRAGRLSVHLNLSRAGAASLRRHHRHLRVTLHASFKGTAGARSAASVVLAFR